MKTIKLILSTLLMMVAIALQAQSVWIYKSDGTKVAYDASLVKSVEYTKFCSIEGVTLLEDYNLDEGKHTFAESLIVSSGTTIPSGATVQYGVVCTADKTIVPTTWGDASNAIATSDGIWQVWAKVTPSADNQGYKEDVICIGEVRISETDYGYYSFNATSATEIAALTESDFTKITDNPLIITPTAAMNGAMPVILSNNGIPTITSQDKTIDVWSDVKNMLTGTATTGTSKTVNGKTYTLYRFTGKVNYDTCKQIKIALY